MERERMHTGWKLSRRGYRSMGDSVPEVMMTDWKRSNTGLMAREASRQLSCDRHTGWWTRERGAVIPVTLQ